MSNEAVYIPVGALADGFAEDSDVLPRVPPQKTALKLYFPDGGQQSCRFTGNAELEWNNQPAVPCRITAIREGIEFIDFVDPQRRSSSLTLICDHQRGGFTLVYGQLPSEQQTRLAAFSRIEQGLALTGVRAEVRSGRLDGPCHADVPLHARSHDLNGMRNQYRYSPHECYEHIYLNSGCYAWHCLQGVEKGLADVDLCQTVKIADELYLFIWQEKVVPTLGVVLIDLAQRRSDGKIFGYRQHGFQEITNFAMGARIIVLNITRHAG